MGIVSSKDIYPFTSVFPNYLTDTIKQNKTRKNACTGVEDLKGGAWLLPDRDLENEKDSTFFMWRKGWSKEREAANAT